MQVTLYCQQGNSDKVYIIDKVAAGGGFVVNFAYGRRGSTLTTGTKTAQPVSETKADRIFSKLQSEKMAKGYFEGSTTSTYAGVATNANPTASQPTGINVQLLNPVEDAELDALLRDDRTGAQEKFDGKRIALVLDNGEIYGVNRTGLRCGIPESFVKSLKNLAALVEQIFSISLEQVILDGEAIGDDFFAFDLLEINNEDFRAKSYLERYKRLKAVLYAGSVNPPVANLFCSDLIVGETAKREFFEQAKANNLEGVVFKNTNAAYEAGRPNSGGSQRKYKFCCEATCLVSGQNGAKRSVSLQVESVDGSMRDIGNCTIPVNFPIPNAGDLAEIRYLYAYPDGALYQPVYKGLRQDKTAPDLYTSLKFKAQTAPTA